MSYEQREIDITINAGFRSVEVNGVAVFDKPTDEFQTYNNTDPVNPDLKSAPPSKLMNTLLNFGVFSIEGKLQFSRPIVVALYTLILCVAFAKDPNSSLSGSDIDQLLFTDQKSPLTLSPTVSDYLNGTGLSLATDLHLSPEIVSILPLGKKYQNLTSEEIFNRMSGQLFPNMDVVSSLIEKVKSGFEGTDLPYTYVYIEYNDQQSGVTITHKIDKETPFRTTFRGTRTDGPHSLPTDLSRIYLEGLISETPTYNYHNVIRTNVGGVYFLLTPNYISVSVADSTLEIGTTPNTGVFNNSWVVRRQSISLPDQIFTIDEFMQMDDASVEAKALIAFLVKQPELAQFAGWITSGAGAISLNPEEAFTPDFLNFFRQIQNLKETKLSADASQDSSELVVIEVDGLVRTELNVSHSPLFEVEILNPDNTPNIEAVLLKQNFIKNLRSGVVQHQDGTFDLTRLPLSEFEEINLSESQNVPQNSIQLSTTISDIGAEITLDLLFTITHRNIAELKLTDSNGNEYDFKILRHPIGEMRLFAQFPDRLSRPQELHLKYTLTDKQVISMNTYTGFSIPDSELNIFQNHAETIPGGQEGLVTMVRDSIYSINPAEVKELLHTKSPDGTYRNASFGEVGVHTLENDTNFCIPAVITSSLIRSSYRNGSYVIAQTYGNWISNDNVLTSAEAHMVIINVDENGLVAIEDNTARGAISTDPHTQALFNDTSIYANQIDKVLYDLDKSTEVDILQIILFSLLSLSSAAALIPTIQLKQAIHGKKDYGFDSKLINQAAMLSSGFERIKSYSKIKALEGETKQTVLKNEEKEKVRNLRKLSRIANNLCNDTTLKVLDFLVFGAFDDEDGINYTFTTMRRLDHLSNEEVTIRIAEHLYNISRYSPADRVKILKKFEKKVMPFLKGADIEYKTIQRALKKITRVVEVPTTSTKAIES